MNTAVDRIVVDRGEIHDGERTGRLQLTRSFQKLPLLLHLASKPAIFNRADVMGNRFPGGLKSHADQSMVTDPTPAS